MSAVIEAERVMAFIVTQRFAEQSSEIATLLDGTKLVFSKDKFDFWCIYHIRNGFAHALRDEEVFSFMQKYTGSIQRFWLYKDFMTVFKLVTTDINYVLINNITNMAMHYEMPPKMSANYSWRRKWQELQLECEVRFFYSQDITLKLSA